MSEKKGGVEEGGGNGLDKYCKLKKQREGEKGEQGGKGE